MDAVVKEYVLGIGMVLHVCQPLHFTYRRGLIRSLTQLQDVENLT